MKQEQKYFSVANLSTYLQCPYKYKLAYIDGVGALYKKPKPYLSIGETIHKVLAHFFSLDIFERNEEKLIELLDKFWVSEGYTTKEQETDYKHQAITWLKNFVKNNDITVVPRYIEEFFRVPIENFYLTGKIDRIDELDDGVEIVDYKTGGYIPTQEEIDNDLQGNIYALCCWEKFRLFPKKVSFIYLQHNHKVSSLKTPQHLELIRNNVIEIANKIYADTEFLPKQNNLCPWCDFLTICPETGMGVKVATRETLERDLKTLNLELEKTINNLSLLNNITLDISEIIDSEKLIQSIPDFIKGLGKTKKVLVYILDEDNKTFNLRKTLGIEKIPVEKISVEEIRTLFHLTTPDAIPKPKIVKFNFFSQLSITSNRDILFLPMVAREKFLGFILTMERVDYKNFTNYDLSLLQNLVNHIAISLHNVQLYELAITDSLTKLYIHRHFITLLAQEILRAERYNSVFSLLMIDIDHFKNINDTYGHLYGDEVLKKIAKIFLSSVRETDIVARYGGEEFAIILIECGKEWAENIAERIRTNVENTEFMFGEKKLNVTVSIGVATFRKGIKKEEIIDCADKALYYAKSSGRNKVVCYEKISVQ